MDIQGAYIRMDQKFLVSRRKKYKKFWPVPKITKKTVARPVLARQKSVLFLVRAYIRRPCNLENGPNLKNNF